MLLLSFLGPGLELGFQAFQFGFFPVLRHSSVLQLPLDFSDNHIVHGAYF